MATLTSSRLKEALNYDPETGTFTWKETRRGLRIGDVAGCLAKHGYIFIRVDKNLYTAHRLAWLYVYGEWPNGNIDHINRNRSDNRISNLRSASQAENCQNKHLRSDNKSGYAGVYWCKNAQKWRAYIGADGKRISLGYFHEKGDAVVAQSDAKARYHPFG